MLSSSLHKEGGTRLSIQILTKFILQATDNNLCNIYTEIIRLCFLSVVIILPHFFYCTLHVNALQFSNLILEEII